MKFDTILIPVDFTINTEIAIQKAVELYADTNSSIHLFHVVDPVSTGTFGYYKYLTARPIDEAQQAAEIKEKLDHWETHIKTRRPDIATCSWVSHGGPVENAVAAKAKSTGANLIIIGKNSQRSLLPFLNTVVPGRLAFRTGIPVLAVKPGALNSFVRTVVVPIDSTFPDNKIEIINWLTDKYFLHVRLLLLVGKHDNPERLQDSLIDICRVLKQTSSENISYEVLRFHNKALDILNFCRKVDADLLVVHPESETKMGLFNKHILDELPVESKTQVLTVSQSKIPIA